MIKIDNYYKLNIKFVAGDTEQDYKGDSFVKVKGIHRYLTKNNMGKRRSAWDFFTSIRLFGCSELIETLRERLWSQSTAKPTVAIEIRYGELELNYIGGKIVSILKAYDWNFEKNKFKKSKPNVATKLNIKPIKTVLKHTTAKPLLPVVFFTTAETEKVEEIELIGGGFDLPY